MDWALQSCSNLITGWVGGCFRGDCLHVGFSPRQAPSVRAALARAPRHAAPRGQQRGFRVDDGLGAAAHGIRSGAGGRPLVVAQPSSPTAASFMELGAGLVREVAKMQRQQRNAVRSAHQHCIPAWGWLSSDHQPDCAGADASFTFTCRRSMVSDRQCNKTPGRCSRHLAESATGVEL